MEFQKDLTLAISQIFNFMHPLKKKIKLTSQEFEKIRNHLRLYINKNCINEVASLYNYISYLKEENYELVKNVKDLEQVSAFKDKPKPKYWSSQRENPDPESFYMERGQRLYELFQIPGAIDKKATHTKASIEEMKAEANEWAKLNEKDIIL